MNCEPSDLDNAPCGSPRCKPRFKGVENFLRKVAFNLGNSPSQTEVKIISCIPIDVTDLQQKIVCLERELEAVKCCKRDNNKTVATVTVTNSSGPSRSSPGPEHSTGPAHSTPGTAHYIPGTTHNVPGPAHSSPGPAHNTPGPAHNNPGSAHYAPDPARCVPGPTHYAPGPAHCAPSQAYCAGGSCSMHDNEPDLLQENDCKCYSREEEMENRYSQLMETETQCNSPKTKRAKLKNSLKRRGRPQFVYYAQTESGPFSSYLSQKRNASVLDAALATKDAGISRTYISEMIQKQYATAPYVTEYPITSQISSPVCRDSDPGQTQLCFNTDRYDPDVCSCLQGTFYNVDKHPADRVCGGNDPHPTCSYSNYSNNSDFYDTSLYDMVPVKEKPTRPPHLIQDITITKRKLCNAQNDDKYFPELNRQKNRYHPFYPKEKTLCVYNCNTVNGPSIPPKKISEKRVKHEKLTPDAKREEVMRELERNQDKTCSFDCGNVYVKKFLRKPKQQPVEKPATPTPAITHKNAECLTNNVQDIDCQTTTSQSVQIDNELLQDDKKTEDTLDQIKVILQTVLTEVKTNTQVKNVPEERPKRDAVVQKGVSQGMMGGPGCSTMLNSYTYSPYNMNPYMPSCSQQVPPCYANLPYVSGKYMHNYPVFIQSPIRNMCSCYRHASLVAKEVKPKPATAATNTESNETHKLIKEIYKSIKVNMDIPAKDTSASEGEGLRSRPPSLKPNNAQKEINLFTTQDTDSKKPDQLRSTSPYSSWSNKSNSNTVSLRSHLVSTTDTENYLRNKRIDSYMENLKLQNASARQKRIEEEYEANTASTTDESSDVERMQDVSPGEEPEKKAEKKGILSKMFRPLKLFKSRPKKKEEEVQVESASESEGSETESEGYQTVYSQEVIQTPRGLIPVRPTRPRAQSKMSFSRQAPRTQDRYRRSPYMDQEYRRQWDEKLMFHENQRHSSAASRSSRDPPASNPTYWRGYEARSALTGAGAGGGDRPRPRPLHACIAPSGPPHVRNKGVTLRIPKKSGGPKTAKGFTWLKKHKPACAGQWKQIILES